MIRLQDLSPEVYYNQSRDFQFIGRLYDIVLNYVKTNADVIYDIPSPDAAYSDLIDLLATTLGFKARHKYNLNQLKAVCSILHYVLKAKGTLKAIKIVLQALLTSEGIKSLYYCEKSSRDSSHLIIFIPVELSSTILFTDILTYILPAGMTYELHKSTIIQVPAAYSTDSAVSELAFYNDKVNSLIAIVPTAEDLSEVNFNTTDENKPGFIANMSIVDDLRISEDE